MSWFSGSGFRDLLQGVFSTNQFRDSLWSFLRDVLAKTIEKNKDNPQALMALANNLKQNTDAIGGAIVKGTEAEKLVQPTDIRQADTVVKK